MQAIRGTSDLHCREEIPLASGSAEHADVRPVAEQPIRKVTANEARRAGHKIEHVPLLAQSCPVNARDPTFDTTSSHVTAR